MWKPFLLSACLLCACAAEPAQYAPGKASTHRGHAVVPGAGTLAAEYNALVNNNEAVESLAQAVFRHAAAGAFLEEFAQEGRRGLIDALLAYAQFISEEPLLEDFTQPFLAKRYENNAGGLRARRIIDDDFGWQRNQFTKVIIAREQARQRQRGGRPGSTTAYFAAEIEHARTQIENERSEPRYGALLARADLPLIDLALYDMLHLVVTIRHGEASSVGDATTERMAVESAARLLMFRAVRAHLKPHVDAMNEDVTPLNKFDLVVIGDAYAALLRNPQHGNGFSPTSLNAALGNTYSLDDSLTETTSTWSMTSGFANKAAYAYGLSAKL